jgi:hypothetical protein
MGSQSSAGSSGGPSAAVPPPIRRSRAWLRFGLGNAQMFTALVALILMFRDGLTSVTLVAVAAACAVTAASRILFARDRHAAAPSAPAAPAAPRRSHNP